MKASRQTNNKIYHDTLIFNNLSVTLKQVRECYTCYMTSFYYHFKECYLIFFQSYFKIHVGFYLSFGKKILKQSSVVYKEFITIQTIHNFLAHFSLMSKDFTMLNYEYQKCW